jgi:Glycosyltransferases involved in cell wall biogenesis
MKPHQPFISIVMPTYNRAGYILDAIQSIEAQTYTHWELLVVDDASDDDTEQVVKAASNDKIVYCKLERIGEPSKVRNKGIPLTKGELVAFLDSDDLWHPDKLQKQVAALQQYPDAGYVLTNGYNFYEPGVPDMYFHKQLEGERYADLFPDVCNGKIAAFSQVLLVRKEVLDEIGPFSEAYHDTTFEFLGRLAHGREGVYLNEPLFYRRLHYSNVNREDPPGNLQFFIDTIQQFAAKKMLPKTEADTAIFKAHIHTGEYDLQNGRKTAARHHFMKAWQYKPFSVVALKKMLKASLP